jgi:hypothetical protein
MKKLPRVVPTHRLPDVPPHQPCTVCFRGDTDTCVALIAMCVDALERFAVAVRLLGVPDAEADNLLAYAMQHDGLTTDDGYTTMILRVCRDCYTAAPVFPAEALIPSASLRLRRFVAVDMDDLDLDEWGGWSMP